MTRNQEAIAWIDNYVAIHESVRGRCAGATREFCEAFPEARRVAGFIQISGENYGEHFWCELDGVIYDPTRSQFPDGVAAYQELQVGDEIRVGTCMECGIPIYAEVDETLNPELSKYGTSCCSAECEAALVEEYRCHPSVTTRETDWCEGCGSPSCKVLWKHGKKCCPDCTHGRYDEETRLLRNEFNRIMHRFCFLVPPPWEEEIDLGGIPF